MSTQAEREFYDRHYQAEISMGPWYRFLLPDLRRELRPGSRVVELGCGQARVLHHLVQCGWVSEQDVAGIDQSEEAIRVGRGLLPRADLSAQDIYQLTFPDRAFDVCLLMEVIEHLEHPERALEQMRRILKPGGLLYISFPNFLHLPWLAVRILAEKLNRPNWIVLQPFDKIYTVYHVLSLVKRAGFVFEQGIGSNYGPPVFYKLETDALTRGLNALGLWRLSFHPILKFRNPS